MVLTLYVDDSGKSDQSPVQVLAGYLSTDERWAVFSKEWTALLDEAGLDAFRMADAWRLARRYRSNGPLARDSLIVRAVECIKRHAQMAFVSSLPFSGFQEYLDLKGDHAHPLGRPYFVGFYSLLWQVYKHAHLYRADQRIEIVLDEQGGESQRYVLSAMSEFRRLASEKLSHLDIPTPRFKRDQDVPPLQAADMLAWLVRRDALNASKGVDRSKRVENLILGEALSMPYEMLIFDQKRLEVASNQMLRSLGLP